jgi:hypothetical protein
MVLVLAVAAVGFVTLLLAGANPQAGGPFQAAAHAGLALFALSMSSSRDSVIETLRRYFPAVAAFLALIGYGLVSAGVFGPGPSLDRFRTETQVLVLLGLGLAFLTTAAAARSAGRRALTMALMALAPTILVLGLVDRADGITDFFGFVPEGAAATGFSASFPNPQTAAAALGLLCVAAAFEWADSIQRRAQQDGERTAQRMAMAALALLSTLAGLWLSQASEAILAAGAGLLAMAAVMLVRGWKRSARQGLLVSLGALALVLFGMGLATNGGAGLAGFKTFNADSPALAAASGAATTAWESRPMGYGLGAGELAPQPPIARADGAARVRGWTTDAHLWMVEGGLTGAALMALTVLGFLGLTFLATDRSRRPSRGAALALGLLITAGLNALASPALATPAVAGLLAILLGLAASLTDALADTRSAAPWWRPGAAPAEKLEGAD